MTKDLMFKPDEATGLIGIEVDAAGRLEKAAANVLRAAETTHGAREALNGCSAGRELDARIKALAACTEAEHQAVTDWKTAKAALAAAEQEER